MLRGIEQSDEVRYQLNALVRKQLSQRYQAEVLAPQVEVTPEEVERTFVEMGFDRERLFARILVRRQQEVDRVLQALHEGEPFAKLAQRFAANDLFAPQGNGVVGWIGRTQAQRFAIPPQTFLSLPVGQIAEPLPLAGGWQIYRFVEDRAADKADYAEEAASAAHREKWQSRLQIEVETLSRSLESPVGPREPTSLAGRADISPTRSPRCRSTALTAERFPWANTFTICARSASGARCKTARRSSHWPAPRSCQPI